MKHRTNERISKASYKRILKGLEYALVVLFLIFSILLGNISGKIIRAMKKDDASIDRLYDISFYNLPTTLYDTHGEKITEFFTHKREIIRLHELPKDFLMVLLAIEDANYYNHIGIDPFSIIRALKNNLKVSIAKKELSIIEGGSTITQQMAKIIYTTREKTLERKIKELGRAFQLEKKYSKKEILEKYINQMYFGHGIYGVESASKFFFGISAKHLNKVQSALLVLILSAPTKYSPINYPQKAMNKHKTVITKLINLGLCSKNTAYKDYKTLWQNMNNTILTGKRKALDYRIDKAPYFSEYIRLELQRLFKEELYYEIANNIKSTKNLSKEQLDDEIDSIIKDMIFKGGLRVYTTLDLRKQQIAQKLLKEQLKRQDKIFNKENKRLYKKIKREYGKTAQFINILMTKGRLNFRSHKKKLHKLRGFIRELKKLSLITTGFGINQLNVLLAENRKELERANKDLRVEGAIISMEPQTGAIEVMVGGSKFIAQNRVNRVFSKRQPGSVFKIFVYGAALKTRRYNPKSVINDSPLKIFDKHANEYWEPKNYNNTFRGEITLEEALKDSINVVSVKLVKQIGVNAVINFASPLLGIPKNKFGKHISISLGTTDVSPYNMCKAMSVYANGGYNVVPQSILLIEDRYGNIILDNRKNKVKAKRKRLIKRRDVRIMTKLLSKVIKEGTGRAVDNVGYRGEAAGKTGTSQNGKDAWFAGYTKELATVVWIGFDEDLTLGKKQYGGNVAAPLWGRFMKEVEGKSKSTRKQNQKK